MRKFGICKEELWPYDDRLLNKMPPDDVYEAANNFTVTPLHIPMDITAIKACLAGQIPALLGVKLIDDANQEAKENGGYISVPDLDDTTIASILPHAVLLVGYNEKTQHFIARNSWGPSWVRTTSALLELCVSHEFVLGISWLFLSPIRISVG
jgi:hypothetical protein